ncbi:hypothetical protein VPH35_139995 [Triticum aestivum]
MAPSPKRRRRDLGSAAAATRRSRTPTTAVSPSADAIFEILSWLPVKSLGRCRCVSAKWRDLISNPAFVAAHRSRAEPLLVAMTDHSVYPRCLQLMDTDGTLVRVLSLTAGASTFYFQGSVDGLACITFGDSSVVNHTQVVDLANRATLPNLPKLVECPCGQTNALFSTSAPPRTPSRRYDCMSGVAVNGALHFLSHDNYVLCFDLESEQWKVIHGPQGAARPRGQDIIGISELNGTLCMSRISPHVINVWLLSDSNKNIWIKGYTIPMDCPADNFVVPLRVLRLDGELLLYNYGFNSKPKLQQYDPRSGRCKDVKTPTNLIGKIGICSLN